MVEKLSYTLMLTVQNQKWNSSENQELKEKQAEAES